MTIPVDSGQPMFRDPDLERDYQLLAGAAYAKDGKKRLPTPDKDKIIALSCSYGKKRLGRQQPLLQHIAHRCREQEVTELSGCSVRKCKLERLERSELSSYGTNSMKSRNLHGTTDGTTGGSEQGRPLFERSYTFFPHRRVLKSPDKQFGIQNGIYLPGLSPGMLRKGTPTKRLPLMNEVSKSLQKVPARHGHSQTTLVSTFTSLPSIKCTDNKRDRVDSYIQARGLHIGTKANSNLSDYQFRSKAVNHQWTSKYASISIV